MLAVVRTLVLRLGDSVISPVVLLISRRLALLPDSTVYVS